MKNKLLLIWWFALCLFSLVGCEELTNVAKAQRTLFTSSFGDNKTLIYGGYKHDVYLGTIDPPKTASDSVWNPSGKYGSNSSEFSIRNKSGKYGSALSPLSACNANATNPPILKDKNYNNYMGQLTLNLNVDGYVVGSAFIRILEELCK